VSRRTTDRFGVASIAVAACVACCAGPILAFIGGVGIAGLASALVIGAAGLAIAVGAGALLVVVHHWRPGCEVPNEEPVAVATPTRRVFTRGPL
jgi:hypothetical protein